jgi:hypothetical protein
MERDFHTRSQIQFFFHPGSRSRGQKSIGSATLFLRIIISSLFLVILPYLVHEGLGVRTQRGCWPRNVLIGGAEV